MRPWAAVLPRSGAVLIALLVGDGRCASCVELVRSPLVPQSKLKQLLPRSWKTKLTSEFPQLSRHLSVMFAICVGRARLRLFHL
jgi:hypothetical protein